MENSLQLAPVLRVVKRHSFPWGWFALALALHGLLLLVPVLRELPAIPVRQVLNVQLWTPPEVIEEIRPPEPIPEPLSETAPEPVLQPDADSSLVSESAPTSPRLEPAPVTAQSPAPAPSTAPPQNPAAPVPTLPTTSELLSDWRWREVPQPEGIRRPVTSEHYAGMRRPLLAQLETAFSETWLPEEVEIVDRWLEPGGVHNVVIRTPGGQTLCGRQEIVGPFRPWEQMPMMFRPCGGGGKR